MGFSGYDTFKVVKRYKGDYSEFSLTNLYMPLTGVDAYSLYHLLTSLDDKHYPFSKLMDHLNIASSNYINETIKKLEGIGLVEVWQNKDEYLLVLNLPLTYNEFMANHILVEFLKGKIGLTEFERLNQTVDTTGYKNKTHGFDDVYERTNSNIKSIISPFFKGLVDNIRIKNEKFDYTYFKLMFDNEVVTNEALEIKEFKDEILRISYHYNLNEEEMYDAVMMCVRIEKDLNLKSVLKYAQKIYSNKSGEVINFKTKEVDPFVYEKLDNNTNRLIDLCEKTSAEKLLKELSGIKPALSELKMIEDLIKNTGFSQGVINFMVLLVTTEKNGEIPPYNYFEKIANTWKRAKIQTTLDAINYVSSKQNQDKETKQTRRGGKTVKEVPDWYGEYEQKLKDAAKKEDNQEELDADELAKKLFSGGNDAKVN